MKKTFKSVLTLKLSVVAITTALVIAPADNAHAQLGKKLKAKLEAAKKKLEDKVGGGEALNPDVSQAVTAATFDTGTYDYWDSNGSEVSLNPDEKNHIEIVKKDGKVSHIVLDKKVKYIPDEKGKSDFVRYFKCETNNWGMFFAGKRIFFLQIRGDNIDWEGVAGKSANYHQYSQARECIIAAKKNQTADLQAYEKNQKAIADAAAAERLKKYSTKGKDVVSIKIVNFKSSKNIGNFEAYWEFSVEAKLKDGTVISTANSSEGYIGDYKITYENFPVPSRPPKVAYSLSKITTGFINGDKIILKVQNKYHPHLKDQKEMVMTYDYKDGKVGFDRSASKWGYNGENTKIEIKQVKHAVTGAPLYQYRVTSLTGNHIVAEGKIKPSQQLLVYANGQPGKPYNYSDMDGTRGGDAGDGGEILIFKDPSITETLDGFLFVKSKGGNGGKGVNYRYDGRPGNDGAIKTIVKKVTF